MRICSAARGSVVLKTSGPFHSSLMKESAQRFSEFLGKFEIRDAVIPFIPNTTGEVTSKAAVIREKLVDQISKAVQWEKSINTSWNQGFDTYIEAGPGRVLRGLIRKIVREAKVHSAADPDSIEKLTQAMPEKFSREQSHKSS